MGGSNTPRSKRVTGGAIPVAVGLRRCSAGQGSLVGTAGLVRTSHPSSVSPQGRIRFRGGSAGTQESSMSQTVGYTVERTGGKAGLVSTCAGGVI